jgi:hypothetical protein
MEYLDSSQNKYALEFLCIIYTLMEILIKKNNIKYVNRPLVQINVWYDVLKLKFGFNF